MEVHVDPVAGVVDAGGARWPLQLDPLSGSLAVQVAGQRVQLRPLRWREKLALARFAQLGERFLERELVRACLVGATDPPEVDGAPEALAALARWLNAPRPGAEEVAGLPFASAVLAAVTVDLCRAAGLRPGDLDDLHAADVEELWRASAASAASVAAATARPGGEADDAGLTRIVIVPDPSPAGERGTGTTGSGDHAAGPEEPHRVVDAPPPPGPRPASPPQAPASGPADRRPALLRFRRVEPVTATPPSPRPLGQPHPAEEAPGDVGASLADGTAGDGGIPGTGTGNRPAAPAPEPEPSAPAAVGAGWAPDAAAGSGTGASPAAQRARAFGGAPSTRAADGRLQAPGPPLAASPGLAFGPSRWPVDGLAPGTGDGGRSRGGGPVTRRLSGVPEAATPEGSAEVPGRLLGAPEREALFEELSERLEQAAIEMGIDLEG